MLPVIIGSALEVFCWDICRFPGVLASAVIMTGHYDGNKAASQLALGATAGMLGCGMCCGDTVGLLAGWGG